MAKSFFGAISDFAFAKNKSTLSGAIDIIAIQQENTVSPGAVPHPQSSTSVPPSPEAADKEVRDLSAPSTATASSNSSATSDATSSPMTPGASSVSSTAASFASAATTTNGVIKCTPWHVRFGKMSGIMNPKERVVQISCNGVKTKLKMKLGDAGEAFFVEEADDLDEAYATSPIVSPMPSPVRVMASVSPLPPLNLDSDDGSETNPSAVDGGTVTAEDMASDSTLGMSPELSGDGTLSPPLVQFSSQPVIKTGLTGGLSRTEASDENDLDVEQKQPEQKQPIRPIPLSSRTTSSSGSQPLKSESFTWNFPWAQRALPFDQHASNVVNFQSAAGDNALLPVQQKDTAIAVNLASEAEASTKKDNHSSRRSFVGSIFSFISGGNTEDDNTTQRATLEAQGTNSKHLLAKETVSISNSESNVPTTPSEDPAKINNSSEDPPENDSRNSKDSAMAAAGLAEEKTPAKEVRSVENQPDHQKINDLSHLRGKPSENISILVREDEPSTDGHDAQRMVNMATSEQVVGIRLDPDPVSERQTIGTNDAYNVGDAGIKDETFVNAAHAQDHSVVDIMNIKLQKNPMPGDGNSAQGDEKMGTHSPGGHPDSDPDSERRASANIGRTHSQEELSRFMQSPNATSLSSTESTSPGANSGGPRASSTNEPQTFHGGRSAIAEMSLCGGAALSSAAVRNGAAPPLQPDVDVFMQHRVKPDMFHSNPLAVLQNPDLVVLVGGRMMPWATAGAHLMSMCAFPTLHESLGGFKMRLEATLTASCKGSGASLPQHSQAEAVGGKEGGGGFFSSWFGGGSSSDASSGELSTKRVVPSNRSAAPSRASALHPVPNSIDNITKEKQISQSSKNIGGKHEMRADGTVGKVRADSSGQCAASATDETQAQTFEMPSVRRNGNLRSLVGNDEPSAVEDREMVDITAPQFPSSTRHVGSTTIPSPPLLTVSVTSPTNESMVIAGSPDSATSVRVAGRGGSIQSAGASTRRRKQVYYRKTLRPTTLELNSLNLKDGENTITFSVKTRRGGVSTLSCSLWCWSSNVNIVISDVDGTITRSDVMGQVMPALGRDWSHTGVVGLYNSIQKNGYHMVYLSSRPIGSSGQTKSYLNDLRQDGQALPAGPLIVSPDRLLTVLAREVYYRRAQEFKIAALRDLKRLFPVSSKPFYAGFGNRPSDVASYGATGVPPGKIFIVDPKSQICSGNGHQLEQDYTSMHRLADLMFPPIVDHHRQSAMSLNGSADGHEGGGFIPRNVLEKRRCSTYLDPTFNSAAYWGSRAGVIESDEDDGKDEDEDDGNLSDLSENSDFGVEDGEYEIDVMLAADEVAAAALSMSPDERKQKSDELEKSPAPHFKSEGHADNKSSIVSTASVD